LAPLSMWATKDQVLAAALDNSVALYVVGLAAAALSAGYAGKILVLTWRRVPAQEAARVSAEHDTEQRGTREVPKLARLPLVVLAFGAAVLGVLALGPWGEAIGSALNGPEYQSAGLSELLISAVLAAVVVLAVWRWTPPEPGWARGWLGLETAAHVVVVAPTLRLADGLARFDDRVLSHGVDELSAATMRTAYQAGRLDDRRVDGTVRWVSAQVRRLGVLARRPQTGQLHQYYLQAVVLVAAGFLLLLTVRG
ncbi:MAG: NADH-quinone oxidoreductase subunit L, partial [Ornithinimicrobium sp.]